MTSPQRGWGGGTKMAIWGDFQVLIRVTGGGGVKNFETWVDVIFRWSLIG